MAYEWNGETIISYRETDDFFSEIPPEVIPIALNDNYDEVPVLPAWKISRAEISSDLK